MRARPKPRDTYTKKRVDQLLQRLEKRIARLEEKERSREYRDQLAAEKDYF